MVPDTRRRLEDQPANRRWSRAWDPVGRPGVGPGLFDCCEGCCRSQRDLSADEGGGDEETRTPDPLLAKEMLCQLSYVPAMSFREVVGAPGLEPGTSALSGPRSNQLSYAPRRHCRPSHRCRHLCCRTSQSPADDGKAAHRVCAFASQATPPPMSVPAIRSTDLAVWSQSELGPHGTASRSSCLTWDAFLPPPPKQERKEACSLERR